MRSPIDILKLFPRFITHFRRVGILSTSTLVVGGVALILFARNVGSSSREDLSNQYTKEAGQGVFRVGSHLSVQSWLAILGAAFGLLSYGFTATCTHAIDWWSGWRARSRGGSGGLNYARYLNSQAQAPVVLGLYHGFPAVILLRYVVVALGIAASVGYKFAVVEVTYFATETIPIEQIRLQPPPLQAIKNGITSPWASDGPGLEPNRAFVHDVSYDDDAALVPPYTITMASWANCSDAFNPRDEGKVVTREIVMIAKLWDRTTYYSMTSDRGDWFRAQSSTGGWFNGSSDLAVIDYRVAELDTIHIQWARLGSWVDDDSGTQSEPIEERLTYGVSYAVAEMHRKVVNNSCSHIYEGSGDLIKISPLPIKKQSANGSVPAIEKFLGALLYAEGTGPRDGVSAILRAIMTGWATQLLEMGPDDSNPPLGHAPPHSEPFGKEENSGPFYRFMGESRTEYPFYYGERAGKQTGSYYTAARAFMGLGILAIVTSAVRVAMGPPVLTSWMGQHVSLALAGAQSDGPEGLKEMASGHQIAGKKLGRLQLVSTGEGMRFQFA